MGEKPEVDCPTSGVMALSFEHAKQRAVVNNFI